MQVVPEDDWTDWQSVISNGRKILARLAKPICSNCLPARTCPAGRSTSRIEAASVSLCDFCRHFVCGVVEFTDDYWREKIRYGGVGAGGGTTQPSHFDPDSHKALKDNSGVDGTQALQEVIDEANGRNRRKL